MHVDLNMFCDGLVFISEKCVRDHADEICYCVFKVRMEGMPAYTGEIENWVLNSGCVPSGSSLRRITTSQTCWARFPRLNEIRSKGAWPSIWQRFDKYLNWVYIWKPSENWRTEQNRTALLGCCHFGYTEKEHQKQQFPQRYCSRSSIKQTNNKKAQV